LTGVAASPGIAIGVAHVLGSRVDVHERRIAAEAVDAELQRFDVALRTTDEQLARIQQQIAQRESDEHQYRVLEAHRLMLSDVHLVEQTRRHIREEHTGAEWAVRKTLDQIQAVFARIEDPYFRDRRSDFAYVGENLLRNLMGAGDAAEPAEVPKGSVAVAHELSPADAAQLGRAEVVGFCTEGGGPHVPHGDHRARHGPAVRRGRRGPRPQGVVGDDPHHRRVARRGHPRPRRGGARALPRARRRRARARPPPSRATRDAPAVTSTACRFTSPPTSRCSRRSRSPSIWAPFRWASSARSSSTLERPDLPSEDEQHLHAVAALKSMQGRRITFRTLDLGGDKLPASVRIPSGTNPAMGLRSIRYSLHRPDLFRTQLRALYRAATVGPMQILFPLISGVAELRAAKQICADVCAELARTGVPHEPKVPIGVMVETPSAALISDLLAAECDFLSIGTNDLIQYALAADRDDEHVGYLYHPLHPAILRALKQVVLGANKAGKPVAMCGDMAGDPMLAWVLLGLGLRNFSMAPRQIPVIKSIIRSTDLFDAERMLAQAMAMSTETEIEDMVYRAMRERFPAEVSEGEG